ncbi:PREDICTED: uncharacterized protein LOC105363146 [Ceratosolen solmsi marchali]|uniref:Uncharacterized protein LOC105363146 n=1 Tax=Ceratosolen solmsi marchali TaxID=326594 RepID=A0AAJ7DWK5_9HYME|nr:PREDICTED: uncharacterized protein LOC105363146 [Ceratosolen solmsi marchali]
MAGGSSRRTKQHGKLIQATLSLSSNCYYHSHCKCKTVGDISTDQEEKEFKDLYQRHINLLRQDINRIFSESLHCDLKVIYGYKVIETNQCIIRIRSPLFYDILRPHFLYKNKTAHYYVKQLRLFCQIKHFIRLLYTNLDISDYEQFFIKIILNNSSLLSKNTHEIPLRESNCSQDINYYMNHYPLGNVSTTDVNDNSPVSSDMADSGLETGSMISPQETISENSSTDLDEPNESSILKRNNGKSISYEKTNISTEHNFFEREASPRHISKIKDEISEYENLVLSDPFYELNGESDEDTNDQVKLYVPTSSFGFNEANNLLCSNNSKKNDDKLLREEKITQNGKNSNILIEKQHIDIHSSSGSSNYYFIDASTLNDDIDVTSKNVVGYSNDINERLIWSNPQPPSSCYIPTSKSNNLFHNDSLKLPNQKANVQCQYNEAKEFKQNVKLTECLEPFGEYRKTKKMDSLVIQDDVNNYKSANKESLTVEVKEADSGESTQHSPCPDNTKVDGIRKMNNNMADIDFECQENPQEKQQHEKQHDEQFEKQEEQPDEEQDEKIDRRASLIRRNTFELDANDEKLSSLRQEYERRQGNLVFQNSITQYSQHLIDDNPYLDSAAQSDSMTINDLPPDTDSKGPPTTSFNVILDKYKLDASEKESDADRLLSDVDIEKDVNCLSRSTSDKLLDNFANDLEIPFNSLPLNVNDDLSLSRDIPKLRRNEVVPILSGGAICTNQEKPTNSPVIRRKTEVTPIVSGGFVNNLETPVKEKSQSRKANRTLTTAWVVDMSDCRNNSIDKPSISKRSRELQTGMSSSFSTSSLNPDKDKEKDKEKAQHSSLGYFVNLDDAQDQKGRLKDLPISHRRRASDIASEKSYCEFFIDLSNKPEKKPPEKFVCPFGKNASMTTSQPGDSKKNMFSMFIDLSEPEGAAGIVKSTSSSKLADSGSEQKQTIIEKKSKPGVFMFIESDSPLVRRRTLSSSRPAFKRHSWNTDKSNEHTPTASEQSTPTVPKKSHKRAQSLSVERIGEFRKIVGDTPARDPEYEPGDTPPNSHVQVIDEELLLSLKSRNHQELEAIKEQAMSESRAKPNQRDDCYSENSVWEKTPTDSSETNRTRKSETFDVSSSASCTSSTSENLELKHNDSTSTTQQIVAAGVKPIKIHEDNNRQHLRNNERQIKANAPRLAPINNFVKLSDLDKRPLSNSISSSTIEAPIRESPYRMSNSVTEMSWIESKLVMTARTVEPIHRTFNKKLSFNTTSTSGQSKIEIFDEISTEGDCEAVVSESDISSLQSSVGRSAHEESTEETETSTSFAMGKPYNRLGEDLLRMFLEEINPDVTIDVAGRRIRAHKCILSSRCQYFAAILSGSWIESTGNIISLQGYSYNAVHFALCHIYSGESCIPDSISIVELATLADMLCLEGLKEVIGFTLKVKYCHLFHKPCTGCSVGVLECMPLAAAYGLDELYRKSLKWVTRHFVRIWPSKEFATLPRELMDKCYHQHIVHMSLDNILQSIMDCDKLLTTLPNVRWAEPVFRLASNLLDACMKYLTDNYSGVLNNENFQSLNRELTWNISRLEDHLLAAAERLSPEQACKAYARLDKMLNCQLADDAECAKSKWNSLFMDLISKMRIQVEKSLIRDAARASRTNAWLKMDLDIRNRIQTLACLVILPNEAPSKRPSRHSNFLKDPKQSQESKTPVNRTPPSKNFDLRRMKMAISEHNDRTFKQTPLLQTRKIMNKPKTDPLERKLHNDKLSNDTSGVSRPKSWPNKIEVKSRYLEPRNRIAAKESAAQPNQDKVLGQQRKKIMISSSDSSRTSSPAMKRAAEKKTLTKTLNKVPIKKDGKALSYDSLTESSSRLSVKKDISSKSCGITRPESPLLKIKKVESGLSIDSLADSKKKPLIKKTNRMDTSMSTDSLMTDITSITTPRSMITNKSSPVLGKVATNLSHNQTQSYEKLKKSSPPSQQRNTPSTARRPGRSLENSTAASRSRAAAVINTYQGSLNLRKSLLDAAKAPDIPSKALNSSTMIRTSLRQSMHSMKSSYIGASIKSEKYERKDETVTNNQRSSSSPATKRSPKSNIGSKLSKSTIVTASKQKPNKFQDKSSNKLKSQTTVTADKEGPKFLNQSSRSGTFLKDEPTILNKSDIQTAAIDL